MKGIIVSGSRSNIENKRTLSIFNIFLLQPFKTGLYGFAAFFTVLILTRGITVLFGFMDSYVVNIDDVYFSLLGFVLVFLIKLLENIKSSKNKKLSSL
ncbi:hypothetical protein BMS3Abin03_01029 [bacterium BMS3Abin03]|nr:hypothetical protein BMS3Abin03_01029 [bacterium BMS3Abin03]